MASPVRSLAPRSRLLLTKLLMRLGFVEQTVLVPLAILIGVVTSAAAVSFHELIVLIRTLLYRNPDFLYGKGIWLLAVIPAVGGLVVALFAKYVIRGREGHGITDVLESVTRSQGDIRPGIAAEKILTSAVTIGTGGSAGAEGPIVQIGAAIASGVGRLFQVSRTHYPVLIGAGSAAGISAIFNSPIGGVLFALEVILLDFSIRTFTPVVVASVVANVTTQAIFSHFHNKEAGRAIFQLPAEMMQHFPPSTWGSIVAFTLLGIICGCVGAAMTRLMYASEERFARLKLSKTVKPALGGALMGVLGILYVVIFGRVLFGAVKPFPFEQYPMPAFFGDGYGAVHRILEGGFYADNPVGRIALLLAFLVMAKLVATCLSLGSGGSGGIIAPSLFLGAAAGGLVGVGFQSLGYTSIEPQYYALIGMGAVLAAVVHAPLAALLILFDVTRQPDAIVPGMVATVVATGMARIIFPDSIYSLSLRQRGVRIGASADISMLRRMSLEQVQLEPVSVLKATTPVEKLLQLTAETGVADFVVVNENGGYAGMVVAEDLRSALLGRDAVPLLLTEDLMRHDLPCVKNTDDLSSVLATFTSYEVSRLPVCLASQTDRVIGLVSRGALMKRYHEALTTT